MKFKGFYFRAVVIKNFLNAIERLIIWGSNHRNIFKKSTFVGFIDHCSHCKFVCVKMPSKLLTRVKNICCETCQWVCITINLLSLKTISNKCCECFAAKHHIYC